MYYRKADLVFGDVDRLKLATLISRLNARYLVATGLHMLSRPSVGTNVAWKSHSLRTMGNMIF
jgi:hypothetical protein